MITIWNSRYNERDLIKIKLSLYEALDFLCVNFGNTEDCCRCKSRRICKDFFNAIRHVEKLVETVKNQNP